MYRFIYKDLLRWKKSSKRKPLIVDGARQVGKTWTLKEFGKKEYEDIAYINCDNNPFMKEIFFDFDTDRLIRDFSAYTGIQIEKRKTLIFIDEIQECPLALTALKYFCEENNDYHIVVAGSLLGIAIHNGTGYPVGKVNRLKMYPMSFEEFLLALDKELLLKNVSELGFEKTKPFKSIYEDLLRQYYYVGGMPEVVKSYVSKKDLFEVRAIQNMIINDYRADFSKHIPSSLVSKVMLVYDSIPAQLAKENKKFIYGFLKKGSRAKDYEDAIEWLIDAGLVYKVNKVSNLNMPLKFYEEHNSFKLYLLDIGLLGAMSKTSAKDVLISNNIFKEYKGAMTEQFVLQEMIKEGIDVYYYTNDNSTCEIDFVIEKEGRVYPIEVKSELNLKAKSLKTVIDKYSLKGLRFSMSDYNKGQDIIDIPLYFIEEWLKTNIPED